MLPLRYLIDRKNGQFMCYRTGQFKTPRQNPYIRTETLLFSASRLQSSGISSTQSIEAIRCKGLANQRHTQSRSLEVGYLYQY